MPDNEMIAATLAAALISNVKPGASPSPEQWAVNVYRDVLKLLTDSNFGHGTVNLSDPPLPRR